MARMNAAPMLKRGGRVGCRNRPCAARGAILLVALASGCASSLPDRADRMRRGYVYYVDGAGGGGALRNYSRGVRQGLLNAGYAGAGEMFKWQTGLGMVADQAASVAYKRRRAGELAREISQFRQEYPATPVALIGFSAGAAVAAFALEALPPGVSVDTVVLLSGSLSADYDLTTALQRVEHRMYITTSHRDGMLQYLMPLTGTADRQPTVHGAVGVDGVRVPPDAAPETQREYAKIVTVPWSEEFARLGDRGGHFDAVNARFVQAIIAPLLMKDAKPVAPRAMDGLVPNPDYERWASFAPGSWVRLRGEQVINGVRTPLTLKITLVARDEQRLVVEREFEVEVGTRAVMPRSGRFVVAARIDPRENPATAPTHIRTELPPARVVVAGRALTCSGYRLQARGDFPQWGGDVDATVYTHDAMPSRVVRVEFRTTLHGEPAEFTGEVVEFVRQHAGDTGPMTAG